MKKYLLATLLIVGALTSCLKEDVVLKSSPHVKSFRFEHHTAAPNIETIQFTIDTINCVIFNEDSVGYGYDLSKLKPTIQFTGTPKEIKMNGNYWSGEDSIDFRQPVSMYILSQNKKSEATYTITVNQHRVNPDEIVWKNPVLLNSHATSFKATSTEQAAYVFAYSQQGETCLYTVYSNTGTQWQQIANFESAFSIISLASLNNQLYAINQEGNTLLRFNQNQWDAVATFTEGTITQLIGSLKNKLWMQGQHSNTPLLISYNEHQLQIEEQSTLPTQFASEGATALQTPYGLYLIGGELDGTSQNCILSSDNGYYWTNILNQTGKYSITPRYNAICAYYNHHIFVMGGYNNHQVVTNNYTSSNNGYSWDNIPSYQQLPDAFYFQEGACATVFNNNLYVFNKPNSGQNGLEVWEGRIRIVDFIKQ